MALAGLVDAHGDGTGRAPRVPTVRCSGQWRWPDWCAHRDGTGRAPRVPTVRCSGQRRWPGWWTRTAMEPDARHASLQWGVVVNGVGRVGVRTAVELDARRRIEPDARRASLQCGVGTLRRRWPAVKVADERGWRCPSHWLAGTNPRGGCRICGVVRCPRCACATSDSTASPPTPRRRQGIR